MRAADAETIRGGTASDELMENAATGLCEALATAFPDWKRVAVVCGPGSNGGDGLAAARLLADRGVLAEVFTLADPRRYRGDSLANFERLRARGIAPLSLASRGGF